MASYNQEIDNIGGGGLGLGFGGGSLGIILVLLILFSCFFKQDGRGHDGGREHDRDFDELRSRFSNHCNCVSTCQVDKDVVTSRDAGIIEQNRIYEKQLECKIQEQNSLIMEQKNQIFVGGMFAELQENLNCKFGMIEKELAHKPNVTPVFAETVSACVRDIDRCGRRDRDDFGFC